ncbi:MAG TPA: FliM/FliN family flagellar motor switch protein [Paracoccaceae bacterium]|nr:FliM/FliN family flagellar motor switch protein [Paracoccaceae bacterium]
MDSAGNLSLLERKIAAHRPRAAQGPSGPEHLLFTAFAREAERKLGLHLGAGAHVSHQRTSAEIADTIPDQALISLLDGPGGTTGVLVMEGGCLSALIEMMTVGEVRPTAAAPRRPTRTDAAMIAGLIDGVLGGFDHLVGGDPASVWAGGFRYASHLADARPLALLLEDPAFRVLTLDLRFGDSGRQGKVSLILPARGRGTITRPLETADETASPPADDTSGADFAEVLGRTVRGVEAELHAVLARIALPLSDLLALERGQSLTLPSDALHQIQIEGADGRLLGLASLGQGGGQRALRLEQLGTGVEAAFAPPVRPAQVVAASDQPLHRAPVPGERIASPPADRHVAPTAADLLAGDVAMPDTEAGPSPELPLARSA